MQIPSMDGEFVGMSLYFFVIDFLKTIYQMDDAHPTIDDIKTLGRSFCSMNWTLFCLRKLTIERRWSTFRENIGTRMMSCWVNVAFR